MQTHSEEVMRAAIIRAVGKEFDFEILSLLPWVRRQLVADSYGTKRIFLAGDGQLVLRRGHVAASPFPFRSP
ncbi:hypothetical protein [Paracoccus mutanolyticus]|uniref:hypothetical protein n=1 Tax=Paracoccus mutanolyticus TaxID=1499308 RepID=UPI001671F3F1|nr:hypothetical protein [Paracoccus mutanolyticus]